MAGRLDPIVICLCDGAWPCSFEAKRNGVTAALRPWLARPVEHIGSTAIAGLSAKPIIDMVAVVTDIDAVRGGIPAMEGARWVHAPEPGDDDDRRLSFCHPNVERRTHHLHVVEEGSEGWRGLLAFRDYLRLHPAEAAEYETLKRDLAARVGGDPDDREPYREGKASFIRQVTDRALAEGLFYG